MRIETPNCLNLNMVIDFELISIDLNFGSEPGDFIVFFIIRHWRTEDEINKY